MIITVSKPFEEISKNLADFSKIFIVGCDACATKCNTGSEEAVKNMKSLLESKGKKVSGYIVLDTPCDMRIVKKDLSKNSELLSSQCILVLACGAGVQAVEKIVDKAIVPGLNPVFVGTTERIGVFHEYCSVCGECILDKTGNICPVSRCAKGMINGPCGGAIGDKCETDIETDCVWVMIYNKLKKIGKDKDIIQPYFPPRKVSKPKSINSGKKL
ncbi:methylenetetrahydrofolate reductase C-terminal domain-containing protein [Elusimicrobiota bacterium]